MSLIKENNKKDPKFEIDDHEYCNIKTLLQKVTSQIGLKKFLLLNRLKTLCRGHMLLVILMVKKLLECFTKVNCKKQIKKNLQFKK